MSDRFRDIAEQAAKETGRRAAERRVVSPIARKAGGCITVILVLLFSAVGVGATILFGRLGGDVDTIGPVAVGVGLLGGIAIGALSGAVVQRILRQLLTR